MDLPVRGGVSLRTWLLANRIMKRKWKVKMRDECAWTWCMIHMHIFVNSMLFTAIYELMPLNMSHAYMAISWVNGKWMYGERLWRIYSCLVLCVLLWCYVYVVLLNLRRKRITFTWSQSITRSASRPCLSCPGRVLPFLDYTDRVVQTVSSIPDCVLPWLDYTGRVAVFS